MDKKFKELNIHQKMELLIEDMVEKGVRFRDAEREFQKLYLEASLKKHDGNKSEMAKALGLHRNTLHNRAKSLKIKKF
ncbi:MAG: helix-turn-helix domain-containing protein [Candidatus Aminicenantes bacterium]|jgi:DNA-binding NtrC family response regulator|nr:helix-turn-helix domain-containing protein [Candidatus Aminicenantes bacterium]